MTNPELKSQEIEHQKWLKRSQLLIGVPAGIGAAAIVAHMPISVEGSESLMEAANYVVAGSLVATIGGTLLSTYKIGMLERQMRQENELKIPE